MYGRTLPSVARLPPPGAREQKVRPVPVTWLNRQPIARKTRRRHRRGRRTIFTQPQAGTHSLALSPSASIGSGGFFPSQPQPHVPTTPTAPSISTTLPPSSATAPPPPPSYPTAPSAPSAQLSALDINQVKPPDLQDQSKTDWRTWQDLVFVTFGMLKLWEFREALQLDPSDVKTQKEEDEFIAKLQTVFEHPFQTNTEWFDYLQRWRRGHNLKFFNQETTNFNLFARDFSTKQDQNSLNGLLRVKSVLTQTMWLYYCSTIEKESQSPLHSYFFPPFQSGPEPRNNFPWVTFDRMVTIMSNELNETQVTKNSTSPILIPNVLYRMEQGVDVDDLEINMGSFSHGTSTSGGQGKQATDDGYVARMAKRHQELKDGKFSFEGDDNPFNLTNRTEWRQHGDFYKPDVSDDKMGVEYGFNNDDEYVSEDEKEENVMNRSENRRYDHFLDPLSHFRHLVVFEDADIEETCNLGSVLISDEIYGFGFPRLFQLDEKGEPFKKYMKSNQVGWFEWFYDPAAGLKNGQERRNVGFAYPAKEKKELIPETYTWDFSNDGKVEEMKQILNDVSVDRLFSHSFWSYANSLSVAEPPKSIFWEMLPTIPCVDVDSVLAQERIRRAKWFMIHWLSFDGLTFDLMDSLYDSKTGQPEENVKLSTEQSIALFGLWFLYDMVSSKNYGVFQPFIRGFIDDPLSWKVIAPEVLNNQNVGYLALPQVESSSGDELAFLLREQVNRYVVRLSPTIPFHLEFIGYFRPRMEHPGFVRFFRMNILNRFSNDLFMSEDNKGLKLSRKCGVQDSSFLFFLYLRSMFVSYQQPLEEDNSDEEDAINNSSNDSGSDADTDSDDESDQSQVVTKIKSKAQEETIAFPIVWNATALFVRFWLQIQHALRFSEDTIPVVLSFSPRYVETQLCIPDQTTFENVAFVQFGADLQMYDDFGQAFERMFRFFFTVENAKSVFFSKASGLLGLFSLGPSLTPWFLGITGGPIGIVISIALSKFLAPDTVIQYLEGLVRRGAKKFTKLLSSLRSWMQLSANQVKKVWDFFKEDRLSLPVFVSAVFAFSYSVGFELFASVSIGALVNMVQSLTGPLFSVLKQSFAGDFSWIENIGLFDYYVQVAITLLLLFPYLFKIAKQDEVPTFPKSGPFQSMISSYTQQLDEGMNSCSPFFPSKSNIGLDLGCSDREGWMIETPPPSESEAPDMSNMYIVSVMRFFLKGEFAELEQLSERARRELKNNVALQGTSLIRKTASPWWCVGKGSGPRNRQNVWHLIRWLHRSFQRVFPETKQELDQLSPEGQPMLMKRENASPIHHITAQVLRWLLNSTDVLPFVPSRVAQSTVDQYNVNDGEYDLDFAVQPGILKLSTSFPMALELYRPRQPVKHISVHVWSRWFGDFLHAPRTQSRRPPINEPLSMAQIEWRFRYHLFSAEYNNTVLVRNLPVIRMILDSCSDLRVPTLLQQAFMHELTESDLDRVMTEAKNSERLTTRETHEWNRIKRATLLLNTSELSEKTLPMGLTDVCGSDSTLALLDVTGQIKCIQPHEMQKEDNLFWMFRRFLITREYFKERHEALLNSTDARRFSGLDFIRDSERVWFFLGQTLRDTLWYAYGYWGLRHRSFLYYWLGKDTIIQMSMQNDWEHSLHQKSAAETQSIWIQSVRYLLFDPGFPLLMNPYQAEGLAVFFPNTLIVTLHPSRSGTLQIRYRRKKRDKTHVHDLFLPDLAKSLYVESVQIVPLLLRLYLFEKFRLPLIHDSRLFQSRMYRHAPDPGFLQRFMNFQLLQFQFKRRVPLAEIAKWMRLLVMVVRVKNNEEPEKEAVALRHIQENQTSWLNRLRSFGKKSVKELASKLSEKMTSLFQSFSNLKTGSIAEVIDLWLRHNMTSFEEMDPVLATFFVWLLMGIPNIKMNEIAEDVKGDEEERFKMRQSSWEATLRRMLSPHAASLRKKKKKTDTNKRKKNVSNIRVRDALQIWDSDEKQGLAEETKTADLEEKDEDSDEDDVEYTTDEESDDDDDSDSGNGSYGSTVHDEQLAEELFIGLPRDKETEQALIHWKQTAVGQEVAMAAFSNIKKKKTPSSSSIQKTDSFWQWFRSVVHQSQQENVANASQVREAERAFRLAVTFEKEKAFPSKESRFKDHDKFVDNTQSTRGAETYDIEHAYEEKDFEYAKNRILWLIHNHLDNWEVIPRIFQIAKHFDLIPKKTPDEERREILNRMGTSGPEFRQREALQPLFSDRVEESYKSLNLLSNVDAMGKRGEEFEQGGCSNLDDPYHKNPAFDVLPNGQIQMRCGKEDWMMKQFPNMETLSKLDASSQQLISHLEHLTQHGCQSINQKVFLWRWVGVSCLGKQATSFMAQMALDMYNSSNDSSASVDELRHNIINEENASKLELIKKELRTPLPATAFNLKKNKQRKNQGSVSLCSIRLQFLEETMFSGILFPFALPGKESVIKVAGMYPGRVVVALDTSKSGAIRTAQYHPQTFSLKEMVYDAEKFIEDHKYASSALRLRIFDDFSGGICLPNELYYTQLRAMMVQQGTSAGYNCIPDPQFIQYMKQRAILPPRLWSSFDALATQPRRDIIEEREFQKLVSMGSMIRLKNLSSHERKVLTNIILLEGMVDPTEDWFMQSQQLYTESMGQDEEEEARKVAATMLCQKPGFAKKLRRMVLQQFPHLQPKLVDAMKKNDLCKLIMNDQHLVEMMNAPVYTWQLQNIPEHFKNEAGEFNRLLNPNMYPDLYQEQNNWLMSTYGIDMVDLNTFHNKISESSTQQEQEAIRRFQKEREERQNRIRQEINEFRLALLNGLSLCEKKEGVSSRQAFDKLDPSMRSVCRWDERQSNIRGKRIVDILQQVIDTYCHPSFTMFGNDLQFLYRFVQTLSTYSTLVQQWIRIDGTVMPEAQSLTITDNSSPCTSLRALYGPFYTRLENKAWDWREASITMFLQNTDVKRLLDGFWQTDFGILEPIISPVSAKWEMFWNTYQTEPTSKMLDLFCVLTILHYAIANQVIKP